MGSSLPCCAVEAAEGVEPIPAGDHLALRLANDPRVNPGAVLDLDGRSVLTVVDDDPGAVPIVGHPVHLELQNGVLQVVFEEPSQAKFVVSPNAPVRQVWVSALSRSYKLPWSAELSGFVLDGEPLNALLERLIRQHLDS